MLDILTNAVYVVEIVVGLGLLIFIHELGHFLMAKRNRVRVEAFSLGMGPILWKRLWNGTEYRVSAIPLGGYVKMAGENISDPRSGAPDELTAKSAWQRLQIFAAGAIMNLVIAFPIAILANMLGRSVFVAQVSLPGHPETRAGMKPGDVIVDVDGMAIESMDQYRKEIVRRPEGVKVPVTVRRGAETLQLEVEQSGSERHARTFPRDTTLATVYRDSPAWKAGLRSGDTVLAVDGEPVVTHYELNEKLRGAPGRTLTLEVQRDKETPFKVALEMPGRRAFLWPEDYRMAEPVVGKVAGFMPADVEVDKVSFLKEGDVIRRIRDRAGVDRDVQHWHDVNSVVEQSPGEAITLTRERAGQKESLEIVPTYSERLKGQLGIMRKGTARVVLVAEDSYYYGQGLRSGDVIVSLERDKQKIFGEVGVIDLFQLPQVEGAVAVEVTREGKPVTLSIAPQSKEVGDLEALGIGNTGGHLIARGTMFMRYWSFGDAIRDGLYEPIDITKLTFQLLKKLVVAEESAKGLAGPVGIFQTSFAHAKMGLGNLLWLLVLITVNLGVFNLLPVPVLDGGHILLLAIEKVRGSPPSARFVERFQLTGLVLLLALIVFVTYNDIARTWLG